MRKQHIEVDVDGAREEDIEVTNPDGSVSTVKKLIAKYRVVQEDRKIVATKQTVIPIGEDSNWHITVDSWNDGKHAWSVKKIVDDEEVFSQSSTTETERMNYMMAYNDALSIVFA